MKSALEVPPQVVASTVATPMVPAGTWTMKGESSTSIAARPLKVTSAGWPSAPIRLLPCSVTRSPAAAAPGVKPVSEGGRQYWKLPARAVPPQVSTSTITLPLPAGTWTSKPTLVGTGASSTTACTPPKVTVGRELSGLSRPRPVMLTTSPTAPWVSAGSSMAEGVVQ